jgi:hypothetical protein
MVLVHRIMCAHTLHFRPHHRRRRRCCLQCFILLPTSANGRHVVEDMADLYTVLTWTQATLRGCQYATLRWQAARRVIQVGCSSSTALIRRPCATPTPLCSYRTWQCMSRGQSVCTDQVYLFCSKGKSQARASGAEHDCLDELYDEEDESDHGRRTTKRACAHAKRSSKLSIQLFQ